MYVSSSIIDLQAVQTGSVADGGKNSQLTGSVATRFRKGDGRARGKKPKGAASLPNAIDRIIDRKGVDRLAESLYNTAESGSVPAHTILLKLGGALKETPTIAIQNNNLSIPQEILDRAKELSKTIVITSPPATVIDVIATPVTSSNDDERAASFLNL
jgi:hypothetical protein